MGTGARHHREIGKDEGHLENTPQRACCAAGTGSVVGGGGDGDTDRGCDRKGLSGQESGNIGLMWSRKPWPLLALADALGTASIRRPGGQYMGSRAHALQAPELPGCTREAGPAGAVPWRSPRCGQRPGEAEGSMVAQTSPSLYSAPLHLPAFPPRVEGSPEESRLQAQVPQKDRKSAKSAGPARRRENSRQPPPVWDPLKAGQWQEPISQM